MLNKILTSLLIVSCICYSQFSDVEIELDLRNISKEHNHLMRDLKNSITSYFENTIFSEENSDLEISLKMLIVIESVSSSNNNSIISSQFFLSNNFDLNQYSKSSVFPYYRGESIIFSTEFSPLGSLLDYFAYMYLGNEVDGLEKLGGSIFYNAAERISVRGKDSNWNQGWEDRLRKCKRTIENTYLREFRFNWYELQYNYGEKQSLQIINQNMDIISNNLYYLKEFYPSDRNTFLFLDIHAEEIAKILGAHKKYDIIALLAIYDVDNKKIYNSQLK